MKNEERGMSNYSLLIVKGVDREAVFGYKCRMKTAFILTGSPRKGGISAKMAEIFAEKWENAAPGNGTAVINAYRAAVRPCVHCGGCQKAPSCVFDDYAAIDSAFKTADVLVVASPVYGLGFPAPLKAVFDRTQQYFEAKFARGVALPIAKYKKGLLLTASGGDNPKSASFMEEELRLVFKIVNAELCGVVSVLNTDRAEPDYGRLACEIAEIIAHKLGIAGR
jgi:NAD(P)H-dependent FMN reductase